MKRWLVLLFVLTACSSEPPRLKTDLDYCGLLTLADLGSQEWQQEPRADGPDSCTWEGAGPVSSARVAIDRDTTVEDLLRGSDEEITTLTLRDRPVKLLCRPTLNPGGLCAAHTQVGERTVLSVQFNSLRGDYRDLTTKATEKAGPAVRHILRRCLVHWS